MRPIVAKEPGGNWERSESGVVLWRRTVIGRKREWELLL